MLAEHVPKYARLPSEYLRALVLRAGHRIIAEGQYVSAETLRTYGVRGDNTKLKNIRDELIAAGELPASCVRPTNVKPQQIIHEDEVIATTTRAAREIVAEGRHVNIKTLRRAGARGSDDRITDVITRLKSIGIVPTATKPAAPQFVDCAEKAVHDYARAWVNVREIAHVNWLSGALARARAQMRVPRSNGRGSPPPPPSTKLDPKKQETP